MTGVQTCALPIFNKQIEQDEVLPSAAVPSLDAAEARIHHNKSPKTHVA